MNDDGKRVRVPAEGPAGQPDEGPCEPACGQEMEPGSVTPEVERIMSSPAYRRVDEDLAFLQRDDTRAVRLQLEYLKPELALQEHDIGSTIVLFGGTRVPEPAAAEQRLSEARTRLRAAPDDPELSAMVQRAERRRALSAYYDVARELATLVGRSPAARRSPRELVIMTGGGPGIMEAGNRGSADLGIPSIGLNVTLPFEQIPNPYITPELCFQFRYFALRKLHFMMRAKALVAFPGGYGTLDELFDALCLVQTRKMPPIPIVLVGEAFWPRLLNLEMLVDEGLIEPADLELFSVVETAGEVWERIRTWYGLEE